MRERKSECLLVRAIFCVAVCVIACKFLTSVEKLLEFWAVASQGKKVKIKIYFENSFLFITLEPNQANDYLR